MSILQWSTALPDWERRIVARQSLVPVGALFPDEAEAALAVFKSLRMVDVAGMPTFGEACDEWVFDFVRAIFGAYDASLAKRLISEFFLLIAKKNGKSTIAAGIMLTALIRNWRHSAELLILAPTIEIAKNSFEPAAAMVRADTDLMDLLLVQDNFRQITHRLTRAVLKVVSADTDTVSGKKAGFVLVDELWVFGKRKGADNMLREATGGLVSRPEGFVIFLSTQSDEEPTGVFESKLKLYRAIRDGTIVDTKKLGVLYEYPDRMVKAEDYLRPETWHIPNPSLGTAVHLEFLIDKFEEARRNGKAQLNSFLAKHANVQIGQKLRVDGWVGAEFWNRRANPALTLESLLERSEVVVIAIDGGGLDDLLGFCVLGRDRVTKKRLVWCRAWVNEIALERRTKMETKIRELEAAGCVVVIGAESAGEDTRQVAALIKQVEESGLLPEKECIAVDRYGANDIYAQLISEAVGFPEEYFAQVNQGTALQGTILGTERRLSSGGIEHDGSPLMTWCVGNACVEKKGNAILVTKEASSEKIDPLMALFGAETLMNLEPEALGVSEILVL